MKLVILNYPEIVGITTYAIKKNEGPHVNNYISWI